MEILIFIGIIVFILLLLYRHYKKEGERYIDHRGYFRNGYRKLIHRQVAYQFLYNSSYALPFREYVIHHTDRNKRNNSPDNLKILTREEHQKEHGF